MLLIPRSVIKIDLIKIEEDWGVRSKEPKLIFFVSYQEVLVDMKPTHALIDVALQQKLEMLVYWYT